MPKSTLLPVKGGTPYEAPTFLVRIEGKHGHTDSRLEALVPLVSFLMQGPNGQRIHILQQGSVECSIPTAY